MFIVAKWLDGSRWHSAWMYASAQTTLLDGDPAPPSPKGGRAAGYIKMPLGMEVGLSPDDFVLDWDPVHPPQKVGGTPQFLLVAFATSLLLHFKVLLTDGERCDVRVRISVESLVLNGIWSCNEIVKEFKVHCCFSDEEQKCGV